MRLKTLQTEAKQLFESLPMPSSQYGIKIAAPITIAFPPSLVEEPIVYHTNSTKIKVKTFAEVDKKLMESYFMKLFSLDSKIMAYHLANLTSGLFIYVPPNTNNGLVTLHSAPTTMQCQHIVVVVEQGSMIEIVDDNKNLADMTKVVEIFALAHSHVRMVSITSSKTCVIRKCGQVNENARLEIVECYHSTPFIRSSSSVSLMGDGAEAKITTLFYGKKSEVFDLSNSIDHQAPHTQSSIVIKGILDNSSKAIARANICMEKNAVKSKGKQTEHILLLSNNAEVDPLPMIEAKANDIVCSHSAAVGRIDPEVLFYMNSRGLNEEEAKKAIITGFFESIHPKVSDEMRAVV